MSSERAAHKRRRVAAPAMSVLTSVVAAALISLACGGSTFGGPAQQNALGDIARTVWGPEIHNARLQIMPLKIDSALPFHEGCEKVQSGSFFNDSRVIIGLVSTVDSTPPAYDGAFIVLDRDATGFDWVVPSSGLHCQAMTFNGDPMPDDFDLCACDDAACGELALNATHKSFAGRITALQYYRMHVRKLAR